LDFITDDAASPLQVEQWLPVVGFEGWYEVSNFGRVKRVRKGAGSYPNRVLKQSPTSNGYLSVNLSKLNKRSTRHVHVLVAQAFIPNPLGLPQVNHKNGKEKLNNDVSNLEWTTAKGNAQHAFKTGLRKNHGEVHHSAKLTWEQVAEIRKRYASGGITQRALAKEYGVTQCPIRRIVSREGWNEREVA
jgi:hypothetical protein